MNRKVIKFFFLPFLLLSFSCNTHGENDETIVLLKTTMGDIKVRLYSDTPLHRDNFLKLIKYGFYDGVSFHRVIKEFMVQAGDPSTKLPSAGSVPDSLKTYTIPAEIKANHFHRKGALAAARQANEINPLMRSSGTQFYIVQGSKFTDEDLNKAEQRINSNIKQAVYTKILKETADSILLTGQTVPQSTIQEAASIKMFEYLASKKDYVIPAEQRAVYKTIGGTPRLDGTYTVFGEVVEGLDVVDRISASPTGINDVPLTDIRILKVKILTK